MSQPQTLPIGKYINEPLEYYTIFTISEIIYQSIAIIASIYAYIQTKKYKSILNKIFPHMILGTVIYGLIKILSIIMPSPGLCRATQFAYILFIWLILGWSSFLSKFIHKYQCQRILFDVERYLKTRAWIYDLCSVAISSCSIVPAFGLQYVQIANHEESYSDCDIKIKSFSDFNLVFQLLFWGAPLLLSLYLIVKVLANCQPRKPNSSQNSIRESLLLGNVQSVTESNPTSSSGDMDQRTSGVSSYPRSKICFLWFPIIVMIGIIPFIVNLFAFFITKIENLYGIEYDYVAFSMIRLVEVITPFAIIRIAKMVQKPGFEDLLQLRKSYQKRNFKLSEESIEYYEESNSIGTLRSGL